MTRRSINFVTSGFGAPVNYTAAGIIGNQFASPFGDPYRVRATNGWIGDLFSGIGKVITPLLPIATPIAGAAVSSLLTPSQQAPTTSTPQSRFDTAAEQAAALNASAAAEKSNQTVYLIAGGAALVALFYFLSKRK